MLNDILQKYKHDVNCHSLIDDINKYLNSDNYNILDIISLTCQFHNITFVGLFEKSRKKLIVQRRSFLFFFCSNLGYKVFALSKEMQWDRKTVYNSIKYMQYLIQKKYNIPALNQYAEYEKYLLKRIKSRYEKVFNYEGINNE